MKNDGITMIALVITIITVLILAGVTIAQIVGDNGVINHALQAQNDYESEEINTQKEYNELEGGLQNYFQGEQNGSIVPDRK